MLEYFVVFTIFYFIYTAIRITILITYKGAEIKCIEEEIARTIEFMAVGMFLYYAYQHNLFNIKEWFFDINNFYKIYGEPDPSYKLF